MTEELFIPKLGQTMEEVTLISWLVGDGVRVEFGTPVLDVETDKAVFSVEANASGYLHIGPYQAGQIVPVLTVVATIGKKEEEFSAPEAALAAEPDTAQAVPEPDKIQQSHEGAQTTAQNEMERRFVSPRARRLAGARHVNTEHLTPSGGQGTRIVEKDVFDYLSKLPKATPVAAKMAASLGLDLAEIDCSGANGTVTKADIEKALSKTASLSQPILAPPVPGVEVTKTVLLSGMRRIIFERMGTSVHTTARVTLVTEVDATDLVAAREKLKNGNQLLGFTPGYNDLLGIIAARALREFPYMNARLNADCSAVEWLAQINLGMAVDTERGLVVPVVRDADRKDLRQFGTAFRELVDRARVGRSLPDDLSGGTFTITNLGMFDIDAFTPVINLPEAAILAIGRIQGKVVPYMGEIAVRQMLTLSLVFDHRLNDGAPAARFLQRIKQYVENPFLLIG